MPDPLVVGVLGQGAVGRAASSRLVGCDFVVHSADRDGRHDVLGAGLDVLVLALTRGDECVAQLHEVDRLPPVVLDLTTQTPESARRCAERVATLGGSYHGGGLSRGGTDLAAGRGVLLLGPPVPVGSPAAAVVTALGRDIPFAVPDQAALAKLLHNWVLLVQQWAAALALAEARAHGVDELVGVLSAGTAGRPVTEWSVVRDAAMVPRSTYRSRLAAKDLGELSRAAPSLARAAGPLLGDLERFLAAAAEQPFTQAFAGILDEARPGLEEAR